VTPPRLYRPHSQLLPDYPIARLTAGLVLKYLCCWFCFPYIDTRATNCCVRRLSVWTLASTTVWTLSLPPAPHPATRRRTNSACRFLGMHTFPPPPSSPSCATYYMCLADTIIRAKLSLSRLPALSFFPTITPPTHTPPFSSLKQRPSIIVLQYTDQAGMRCSTAVPQTSCQFGLICYLHCLHPLSPRFCVFVCACVGGAVNAH